jgi:hypothetical protein
VTSNEKSAAAMTVMTKNDIAFLLVEELPLASPLVMAVCTGIEYPHPTAVFVFEHRDVVAHLTKLFRFWCAFVCLCCVWLLARIYGCNEDEYLKPNRFKGIEYTCARELRDEELCATSKRREESLSNYCK